MGKDFIALWTGSPLSNAVFHTYHKEQRSYHVRKQVIEDSTSIPPTKYCQRVMIQEISCEPTLKNTNDKTKTLHERKDFRLGQTVDII